MQLFTCLGFLLATSLFILRMWVDVLTMPVYLLIEDCALSVAIWEHNRIVTAIAMATWMVNLAACIYSVSVSQRTWIQLLN